MKILYLNNIASMQTITALGMNQLKGIDAKCLIFTKNKYSSTNEITFFEEISRYKINPYKRLKLLLTEKQKILEWFDWADVIHYAWGPIFKDGRDLKWVKKTGKPVFIEWVGCDIRNYDYLREINPHYNNFYDVISKEQNFNIKRVKKYLSIFNDIQAVPTLCPEMSLFIDKEMFTEHTKLFQRINMSDFCEKYPDVNNTKPLIVHSPTSPILKGTFVITDVINNLKKNYDFDFKLITNMTRSEALEVMQKADIFLDQIILGSYGMSSIEAMSYGKPVMTYIMSEVFEAGLPKECPIVNSNPDNLEDNLIELITDAKLRNTLGTLGRAYVKKYHDVSAVLPQMLEWYTKSLKN